VFQVDVRGSVGHGRSFRDQLTNYGAQDIEDLHSGVEYLKTLPYADVTRVGIWGSSYGGLMTAMSLFRKPGVYRAGVASAPATNLWHALDGQERVVGRPHARPDLYREASASSYGEDLKDALLIIHGMQDDIVMFKDSVVLAEKLMMLGKKFDFAFAPAAVHAWARKDYVAAYMLDKIVTHFERHLGRGPAAVRSTAQR
jgi:dipeptidyl-peptidase-4